MTDKKPLTFDDMTDAQKIAHCEAKYVRPAFEGLRERVYSVGLTEDDCQFLTGMFTALADEVDEP